MIVWVITGTHVRRNIFVIDVYTFYFGEHLKPMVLSAINVYKTSIILFNTKTFIEGKIWKVFAITFRHYELASFS